MGHPALKDALTGLKADGGTITVITHGAEGEIQVDGHYVAGFGTGTGADSAGCPNAPAQLDGMGAKTNVTINLAVCKADATATGITKVKDSLEAEIESLGGTATTIASAANVKVFVSQCGRIVVPLNSTELAAVQAAIQSTDVRGVPFKDQYSKLQKAIDDAIGAGKVVATLEYYADIDGTIIRVLLQAVCDFDPHVETDGTCSSCETIPTLSEWAVVTMALLLVGGTVVFRRMGVAG